MAKSKGPKFYAVAKGRIPGIYHTWAQCEAQVSPSGLSPILYQQEIIVIAQYNIISSSSRPRR